MTVEEQLEKMKEEFDSKFERLCSEEMKKDFHIFVYKHGIDDIFGKEADRIADAFISMLKQGLAEQSMRKATALVADEVLGNLMKEEDES